MKISIVTVCLNAAATIRDTIESVLAQDYADLEYIVVDGASSDGTLAIVSEYGDRIARVHSERDRGMYESFNRGLALATGEVVGFLNSDDFFADAGAAGAIARGFAGRAVDCVYGDLDFVDRDGASRVTRRFRAGPFVPGAFRRGWHPPHPTFYARRALLQRLGGFDERFGVAADFDLMLRMLEVERAAAAYLPRVLVHMRQGGVSNRSVAAIWRANLACRRALAARGMPVPWWFVLRKPLGKLRQLLPGS
jgi:glycosyltransferase involved in cell wall biosynthesis